MIGSELRYMNSASHDITLSGSRAKILPFAQQEMVERFVSSIDSRSENKVVEKSMELLRELRKGLLGILSTESVEETAFLNGVLEEAENRFIDALKEEAFADLRRKSQIEMEGMVEFMPKVELAQIAESLVELTSIKRRVSRGFETVGGPIDVAVISRSEGFVWIKRKHYFPPEINARFFKRVGAGAKPGVAGYGHDEHSSTSGDGAGSEAARRGDEKGPSRRKARENDAVPQGAPRRVRKRKANQSQSDQRA